MSFVEIVMREVIKMTQLLFVNHNMGMCLFDVGRLSNGLSKA